ncbi:MAG: 2-C-methyl-D-erythritol 2,4-cyclodiphosphate synthase [Burkholderiales bacterium]|nr:2-C-methyl-D-erythritol 2,4-cyclodiphosphate synthase [Phycisphaerae bacterium]
MRIGHGYDIHRLKQGGRLVLAGVVVSTEISPDAHSDGDVVLHAIVDAILGAIGAGDIGEHFSDQDPRWKDADSAVFVRHALKLARNAGFVVGNADVSILAERPRLKAFKPAMKAALEAILSAPANIKAGTNEACDAIGRGEAIACHAVVLLLKDAAQG